MSAFKRGTEFPNEGFVHAAIQAHFRRAGYDQVAGGNVDFSFVRESDGTSWLIEAKGETAARGTDFQTGLGQLLQRMKEPSTTYALALPNTPEFVTLCSSVSLWVRARLGIHWLWVAENGAVVVVAPPLA